MTIDKPSNAARRLTPDCRARSTIPSTPSSVRSGS